MMKSILVIAMFALIGYSLISAASLQLGDNEIPESMEDFKESFQRLLRDVSEQIKEHGDFDEKPDFERFVQENKLEDEEASILIEEEEEFAGYKLSAVEDDRANENANCKIHCSWHGRSGHCCVSVVLPKRIISICVLVIIEPPNGMKITLMLNGSVVWQHWLATRYNYRFCLSRDSSKVCIFFNNVYVSPHSAKLCLALYAMFDHISYRRILGCFFRRFSKDEIATANETPIHFPGNQKINDIISIPKENKQTNNLFRFEQ